MGMGAKAAQANNAMAAPIGKKELALAIGWTRPKLDRRLESDPQFPIVSRGDQSGGWKFDLAKVRSYLGGGAAPAKVAKVPAIDKAQLRDVVKPPEAPAPKPTPAPRKSAHHHGEATARQRKDLADAQLRENKLRQENAELVERSELRQDLAGVFASLASDLDALPEDIAKHLNLPDAAPIVRDLIDKARARMVERAAPLIADE